MLNARQDPDLASAVIDHITADLTPGDVFGDDAIKTYVKENFDPEETHGEQSLIAWARDHEPDELFLDKTLEDWAEANGFVKA